jgi:hypothetical protein
MLKTTRGEGTRGETPFWYYFFPARLFFGGGLYTMPSSFMPSGSVK